MQDCFRNRQGNQTIEVDKVPWCGGQGFEPDTEEGSLSLVAIGQPCFTQGAHTQWPTVRQEASAGRTKVSVGRDRDSVCRPVGWGGPAQPSAPGTPHGVSPRPPPGFVERKPSTTCLSNKLQKRQQTVLQLCKRTSLGKKHPTGETKEAADERGATPAPLLVGQPPPRGDIRAWKGQRDAGRLLPTGARPHAQAGM